AHRTGVGDDRTNDEHDGRHARQGYPRNAVREQQLDAHEHQDERPEPPQVHPEVRWQVARVLEQEDATDENQNERPYHATATALTRHGWRIDGCAQADDLSGPNRSAWRAGSH